jgi:4-aminobutyrate aminotransferase-like enzyme
MKPILAPNAYDRRAPCEFDPEFAARLARRDKLFGAAYLDVYNNVQSVGHCHPSRRAASVPIIDGGRILPESPAARAAAD